MATNVNITNTGMASAKTASRTEKTCVTCLSGEELGMAFGRDRVIHAAVLAGGLADRVRDESLRLEGFRVGVDRQPFGNEAAKDAAGEGSRGKG